MTAGSCTPGTLGRFVATPSAWMIGKLPACSMFAMHARCPCLAFSNGGTQSLMRSPSRSICIYNYHCSYEDNAIPPRGSQCMIGCICCLFRSLEKVRKMQAVQHVERNQVLHTRIYTYPSLSCTVKEAGSYLHYTLIKNEEKDTF